LSSGSSIYSLSTQSDGFFALGSLIVFGFSKSQSSFKFPEASIFPSTRISYVSSGFTIKTYECVNSSSGAVTSDFF